MTKDIGPVETRGHGGATIPLRLLGGLVIAFLLGCAAHGLARNAITGTPLSFSTPELINFVLSVLLSGASIFLAVAAIALGKFSEQAIMQRSDESIRLQSEVFQKTTDALQRIESSTGVTEKRIEDIISGRVGDLSQKIARIATEQQEVEGRLGAKDIEETVRRSIYQTLREEGIFRGGGGFGEERRRLIEAEEARQKQRREYDGMTGRLLRALSSRDDLKAVKMGRGNVSGSGDEMYDGIYMTQEGRRIGVIDFAPHQTPETVRRGVVGALGDLQAGNVARTWVFIYDGNEALEKAFADGVAIAEPALRARMSMYVCPHEKIEEVAAGLSSVNGLVAVTSEPQRMG